MRPKALTFRDMYASIQEYQHKLGYDTTLWPVEKQQQYFNECALALNQEVAELVDSTPWKPWRKREDQVMDLQNAEREIIDCFFFLFNMANCLGISPSDLEARFETVLSNNYKRIQDGYNKT